MAAEPSLLFFYPDLVIIESTQAGNGRIPALPGSPTNVELIQYHSPAGGRDPELSRPNRLGYRHIAFAVEDIAAEVERLKAAGVELQSGIQARERTGKKLVYFYGPDGIILEFAEYPKT